MSSTDSSSPLTPSSLRSGTSHDVIVVGARAAGAATAMLLARRELRILLLDHGALGADTTSVHALMRGGVLQLSRWGLLDEIVAKGTPPVRRTTIRYGDEHHTTSIKPANGVDALYAPRRTILDPMLVHAAVRAGVEVQHCTSVTDLIMRGDRVAGVQAFTADQRFVDLGASLVIGADGIHSTVARRAGATFSRVGEHASAMTYAYWSDIATDGYEWEFHPNACFGVIPTNDGQACVFASASPERIGAGGPALIAEIVAESAPALAAQLRTAPYPHGMRTWSGHPGYIRASHGPGWALVGDAGYFTDPIGTHGLTDAFRDAELLARAVIVAGDDESSLDEALEHYETTRDQLATPLFDAVDRIAGHEWADEEIGRLLAEVSSAMTDEVDVLAAFEQDSVS